MNIINCINSLENDNCTNEESDRSLSREGRKLLFPTSTIYQVSLNFKVIGLDKSFN